MLREVEQLAQGDTSGKVVELPPIQNRIRPAKTKNKTKRKGLCTKYFKPVFVEVAVNTFQENFHLLNPNL